ncbi:LysR family transcriptional regulator [Rhizobium grahamii]|uniref:HTH lysR-type domain-containing protein n=1 Tax=Rhizobium grahamii TaxID=1120045 RepID=A0A370KTD3_9HYPH|nr:LysR family transcriptional regulator [Rhizobium grahamii]RDJ13921.1 hypothetical protein B5K06_08090 [Rhizobium grahamii]
MIELKHVYLFTLVVDLGGFDKASGTARLTPSSIRQRVCELESTLGAKLLNCVGRTISMTVVGAGFYSYAVQVVRSASLARAALHAELDGRLEPDTATLEILSYLDPFQ